MDNATIRSRTEVQEKRARLKELIDERMKELGFLRYEEFADHYGIGRSTIYELLRGRTRSRGAYVLPRSQTMILLAVALDKPLHEIVYLLLPDAPGAEQLEQLTQGNTAQLVPVAVAGWVGAGPDQDVWTDETIAVDRDFARSKDLVAFRIRGDSMAAGRVPIHDGDTVLVNRNDKGANTDSVVARLEGDGYVCKMLKDDKFGRMLQSRNPEHTNGTPSAIPMSHVAEIVGKVVRVVHDTE